MATVEERLSALESAMENVKLRIAAGRAPRAWLDQVAGSLQTWPEFDEVLRFGREFRGSVTDPDDGPAKEG
jgi:hypothetical protein